MMRTAREDVRQSCQEVRAICARPIDAGAAIFDEICTLVRRIGDLAASPDIGAVAACAAPRTGSSPKQAEMLHAGAFRAP